MAIKFFKGFEIVATAHQEPVIDRWSVDITIRERTPTGFVEKHQHNLPENFESEEKAVQAGIEYGERIVVSWKDDQ